MRGRKRSKDDACLLVTTMTSRRLTGQLADSTPQVSRFVGPDSRLREAHSHDLMFAEQTVAEYESRSGGNTRTDEDAFLRIATSEECRVSIAARVTAYGEATRAEFAERSAKALAAVPDVDTSVLLGENSTGRSMRRRAK